MYTLIYIKSSREKELQYQISNLPCDTKENYNYMKLPLLINR